MRPGQVRRVLESLGNAMQLDRDEPEAVAHEIAHSILLFGKVFIGCARAIADRCEQMPNTRSDRHEIRAIALQHAAMRALHTPQALRSIADGSRLCFANPLLRSSTAEIVRRVQVNPASRRHVRLFVQTVRRFAYYERFPEAKRDSPRRRKAK